MTEQRKTEKARRPIWYFVGWMLFIVGCLIVIAGILSLFFVFPDSLNVEASAVGKTHPDLWWGGFIALFGGFYVWKFRRARINQE
jgi:hypothetical protein